MHFNQNQRANMKAALRIAIGVKVAQEDDTAVIILSELLKEFILEEMRLPDTAQNNPVAVNFEDTQEVIVPDATPLSLSATE